MSIRPATGGGDKVFDLSGGIGARRLPRPRSSSHGLTMGSRPRRCPRLRRVDWKEKGMDAMVEPWHDEGRNDPPSSRTQAQPESRDRGGTGQGVEPRNRRGPSGSPIPGRAFGLPGMTPWERAPRKGGDLTPPSIVITGLDPVIQTAMVPQVKAGRLESKGNGCHGRAMA